MSLLVMLTSSNLSAQETSIVRINPGQDIQAIVNSQPAGTAYVLRAGYHRMQTITPKDGDAFIGEDGAVLSGARLLTDFQREGSYWVATNQTQQGPRTGVCWSDSPRCKHGEDLFFDNQPLRHVPSLSEVGPGSYYFDYDSNKIYFVDDPTGHVVETSVTSAGAFVGSARNVKIQNLVIEKYATSGQYGAVRGVSSDGWLLYGNIVRLNHGIGINIGNRMRVMNNRILQNGQMGIGGIGDDVIVENNEIAYNNYANFDAGWEAGGSKFVQTHNLVLRNNYVHNNNGPGLWLDISNIDSLIEQNLVVYNYSAGIFHEIGYAAIIRNNTVKFNNARSTAWLFGSQILLSTSRDTEVYGNTVVVSDQGGNGITIVYQGRGSGTYGPYAALNNYVHDNTIIHVGTVGTSGVARDVSVDQSFWKSNHFDANTYYVPSRSYSAWNWDDRSLTWDGMRQEGQELSGNVNIGIPDGALEIPDWDPGTLLQTPFAGPVGTEGRVASGLQVFYTFDEGVGSVLHDQSGQANPIDLTIGDTNAVLWGPSALRISQPVIISSVTQEPRLSEALRASNSLTIEAWIDPYTLTQAGPARIVSLSSSPTSRNFTLGQNGNALDVRLRTTSTNQNGEPSIQTDPYTLTDGLMQVVYTRDTSGYVTIYINNEAVKSGYVTGDLSNWDQEYTLLLANEASQDRPWLGDLHLVAIYDRVLDISEIAQNYAAGIDGETAQPTPTPDQTDIPTNSIEWIAPTDTIETIGNPLYQWMAVDESTGYAVYVGPSGTLVPGVFYGTVSASVCIDAICSVDLTTQMEANALDSNALLYDGNWMVFVNPDPDNLNTWEGPFEFTVDAPQPAIPTLNGVTDGDTVSFRLDGDAVYSAAFYLYLASQDDILNPIVNRLFTRQELCGTWAGTICSYTLSTELTDGVNYTLYLQSYGAGGLATGGNLPGLDGWQECKFDPAYGTCMGVPTPPTNLSVSYDSGTAILTWTSSTDATAYQVWVGTMTPLNQVYFATMTPFDLGCTPGDTCTLAVSDITEAGTYSWFVQADGPGGIPQNDLLGWVIGQEFTVQQ